MHLRMYVEQNKVEECIHDSRLLQWLGSKLCKGCGFESQSLPSAHAAG